MSTQAQVHSSHSPTFAVVLTLLLLFAAVQAAAVLVRIVPQMQTAAMDREDARVEAPIQEILPDNLPHRPAPAVMPGQALQEISEAEKFLRVGDFDNALGHFDRSVSMLTEANPELAEILYQRGFVLEKLERNEEAFDQYRHILSMQNVQPQIAQRVQFRLENLPESVVAVPPVSEMPLTSEEANPIRDEVGIQPGATFGIVGTRFLDSEDEKNQVLRIAIKARQDAEINAGNMQVAVYFYEKDPDGEVVPTEANVVSKWISSPIDWAGGDPELLDVQYSLEESIDTAAQPREFFGYTVGIYYGQELQDLRAEPADLERQFPLQLILPEIEQ